jgi:hypothetical protein
MNGVCGSTAWATTKLVVMKEVVCVAKMCEVFCDKG